MTRLSLMALAALPAFLFGANDAHAVRTLLADLLARTPAAQGQLTRETVSSSMEIPFGGNIVWHHRLQRRNGRIF